jgi:signal transduction histidine kinase
MKGCGSDGGGEEQPVELDRLKTDFIGRISHELRTPLTIISGFTTTLIAHNQRLGADQRLEMLERIDVAADRLEVLLDELLAVTSIGLGAPNLAEISLAEVFETVVADLVASQGHDPADRSRLIIDCPPELRLVTEATLLRRAIRLLLDSAVEGDGFVTLRASADHDGPDSADRAVTVEVIDDRPGSKLDVPLVEVLAGCLSARLEAGDNPAGSGAVVRLRFSAVPSSSSP